MSNPLIRSCDHYVVLEPGKKEQFMTAKETLVWLEMWLEVIDPFPKDLQEERSNTSAAKRLLDIACDLEVKPGFTVQWFAVRLDQPEK